MSREAVSPGTPEPCPGDEPQWRCLTRRCKHFPVTAATNTLRIPELARLLAHWGHPDESCGQCLGSDISRLEKVEEITVRDP
jgi:hypothetical protein